MKDLKQDLKTDLKKNPTELSSLSFEVKPIAIIHSPYKEKFAIPRQPGLATAAKMTIELLPPFNQSDAIRGLESISHIWVEFIFHQANYKENTLTVRPPRLGGNERLGVFATRATHRPNRIGLSCVKLKEITKDNHLVIEGGDFLDGTPVIDIKPYLPYSDSISDAVNEVAPSQPRLIEVEFKADEFPDLFRSTYPDIKELIIQVLSQNPKPAYQTPDPERVYGVLIGDLEVKWRYPASNKIKVIDLSLIT